MSFYPSELKEKVENKGIIFQIAQDCRAITSLSLTQNEFILVQ